MYPHMCQENFFIWKGKSYIIDHLETLLKMRGGRGIHPLGGLPFRERYGVRLQIADKNKRIIGKKGFHQNHII